VFVIVGGCVCYCGRCVCNCVVSVFVNVIFVWLFKFNNVVWDDVGEVRGWSFIRCCLCQFEIGAVDKGLLDLLVSHFFVPHYGVSALCLKFTEHVDHNSCVVQ